MTSGKIIEIIGLAGSGKTTLINALAEKKSEFLIEKLPPVRNIYYFPFFIKNYLTSFLQIIRLQRSANRTFSQRELAWMAILNGWPQILKKIGGRVILLDQGPVFLIASLIGLNPCIHTIEVLQSAWVELLQKWADKLDLIIWLDAENEILSDRIETREKNHIVKGKPEFEVIEFLTHNRKIFGLLMEEIKKINPKIKILKINTGQYSLPDAVNKVITEIYRL